MLRRVPLGQIISNGFQRLGKFNGKIVKFWVYIDPKNPIEVDIEIFTYENELMFSGSFTKSTVIKPRDVVDAFDRNGNQVRTTDYFYNVGPIGIRVTGLREDEILQNIVIIWDDLGSPYE